MTQRPSQSTIFAIALVCLGMTLVSCNPGEPDDSPEAVIPEAMEAIEMDGSDPPAESNGSPKIANVEASAVSGGSDSAATEAESTSSMAQAQSKQPKAAEVQPQEPQAPQTVDIRIDETVCGAGGQEAYFETEIQEIYICKNAEGLLTYIATPKKAGNSSFLPAQKIQQGDVVGYAAMDETQTYIVTPGGFQLQVNGKPSRSEKVIRRQLAAE